MAFELHLALRYLFARRRQAFISVISLVSTLGVTVGVTALIVALALMTGLQGELRSRILGAGAHVYVQKAGGFDDAAAEAERMRALPGVTGASAATFGKALIRTDRGDGFVTLKGIDPGHEDAVTDLATAMVEGEVGDLVRPEGEGEASVPGVLIGVDLASQLGAGVGDSVNVTTPDGTLSPMGIIPRARRLRIVGLFRLGLFEFDSAYAYVSLPVASHLLRREPDVIELKVADLYRAPEIADEIPDRFGPTYVAQDWTDMNRALFSALWLEKMAISITIGLIVMVAALNIIASLVLLVMEKSRDIAILKTMGASSRSVMLVFMVQGLVIGLIGTAAGSALGVGLSWVADRYRLIQIPSDVYQIAYVPFVVLPGDFLVVVCLAVLICFVATIYPSRQAARLDPVQALRFE